MPASERRKTTVSGRTAPAEREREFRVAFDDIEAAKVVPNGGCDRRGIDHVVQRHGRLDDPQIPARQEHPWTRDVDRVSRQLHAVLRGADRRGADALARREQRKRETPCHQTLANRTSEAAAQVTEIAFFAPVNVLAHAAREHHALDTRCRAERVGQPQSLDLRWCRVLREHSHERVGHPRRDALDVVLAYLLAEVPAATRKGGKTPAGRVEACETPLPVDDDQTPAELDRRRADDVTGLDEGQFRGTATNIDIEKRRQVIVRHLGRSGAIRGEHRLHVVPGRRAYEFTAHLREHIGDSLGVLAAQCLAGENDRAGVHVVRMDAGSLVGRVDDASDGLIVDALIAQIRGQRDRRLVHGLAAPPRSTGW